MRLIKVCGMRDPENIRQVESLGVDWMGFIFYAKSPRYVEALPSYLPKQAKRIGVFVNHSEDEIIAKVNEFELDGIQLHGEESPEFCKHIRGLLPRNVLVNKAFGLKTEEDISRVSLYEGVCDYYVFDTQTKAKGGSGKTFDWNILQLYKGKRKFLLSGGLGIENLSELSNFHHEQMVGIDLNSKFETEPALKDIEKLSFYLKKIKENE